MLELLLKIQKAIAAAGKLLQTEIDALTKFLPTFYVYIGWVGGLVGIYTHSYKVNTITST